MFTAFLNPYCNYIDIAKGDKKLYLCTTPND
jgi:hypothetical protein